MLFDRIRYRELPSLLVKCNVAYRQYASTYLRGRDIWSVLPAEFTKARRAFQSEAHPLTRFLQSTSDEYIYVRLPAPSGAGASHPRIIASRVTG